MSGAVCCICGARVSERFWCCKECQIVYSLDGVANWPEWAKFLRTEEQRRRERRPAEQERRALRRYPVAPRQHGDVSAEEQRERFLAEERLRAEIRYSDVVDVASLADLPEDFADAIEGDWYGDG